jgi:FkbM family methyltransferase
MSERIIERGLIRLWRRSVPTFSVAAGTHHVRISGHNIKAAPLLTWKANWKTHVIKSLMHDRPGDFIDVGANVGQTLLDFHAAGAGARYVGFEPNPRSFSSLTTLIAENQFPSCVVLPIGLWDRVAILMLYSSRGSTTDSGASLDATLRPSRTASGEAVVCLPFDLVRKDLSIDRISVIKIDVEGSEFEVLSGMRGSLLESRAPVLCEILHADAHADLSLYEQKVNKISSCLGDLGYRALRIERQHDQFTGLQEVQAFPVQVWTAESANNCDYLLAPSEALPRCYGLGSVPASNSQPLRR